MTSPDGLQRLDRCFACRSTPLSRVGQFHYLADQAGFVPHEWLWWCRRAAVLLRCPSCGSQGPELRPTSPVLDIWYERQTYAAADVITDGHRRAQARLGDLKGQTLVDVGCGSGAFLDLVPRATAYGLEPSSESVRFGQSRGRRLLRPDSTGWSAELPPTVDVLSLFDVVEHLLEPRAFLRGLLSHLRPGGRLVIFTGNAGSPWARRWNTRWWYHGWAGHLSCFSAGGLVSLLAEQGLQVESVDELAYGLVPFSLRSLLKTAFPRIASRTNALQFVDALRPPLAASPFGRDHVLVIARLPA